VWKSTTGKHHKRRGSKTGATGQKKNKVPTKLFHFNSFLFFVGMFAQILPRYPHSAFSILSPSFFLQPFIFVGQLNKHSIISNKKKNELSYPHPKKRDPISLKS
jgi:hypothetical protein